MATHNMVARRAITQHRTRSFARSMSTATMCAIANLRREGRRVKDARQSSRSRRAGATCFGRGTERRDCACGATGTVGSRARSQAASRSARAACPIACASWVLRSTSQNDGYRRNVSSTTRRVSTSCSRSAGATTADSARTRSPTSGYRSNKYQDHANACAVASYPAEQQRDHLVAQLFSRHRAPIGRLDQEPEHVVVTADRAALPDQPVDDAVQRR
jgi:hypothetical protein